MPARRPRRTIRTRERHNTYRNREVVQLCNSVQSNTVARLRDIARSLQLVIPSRITKQQLCGIIGNALSIAIQNIQTIEDNPDFQDLYFDEYYDFVDMTLLLEPVKARDGKYYNRQTYNELVKLYEPPERRPVVRSPWRGDIILKPIELPIDEEKQREVLRFVSEQGLVDTVEQYDMTPVRQAGDEHRRQQLERDMELYETDMAWRQELLGQSYIRELQEEARRVEQLTPQQRLSEERRSSTVIVSRVEELMELSTNEVAPSGVAINANVDLTPGAIPEGVTKVRFGNMYNKSLSSPGILPSTVTDIVFGEEFNSDIVPNVLPIQCKSIEFGSQYNQSLSNGFLKNTQIESLTLGIRFNQDLVELPSSINHIMVKNKHYNHRIPPELFASNSGLTIGMIMTLDEFSERGIISSQDMETHDIKYRFLGAAGPGRLLLLSRN